MEIGAVSCISDRKRKKNQELVEEMFAEIEKDALDGISSEVIETFMEVYRKIYGNLLQARIERQ